MKAVVIKVLGSFENSTIFLPASVNVKLVTSAGQDHGLPSDCLRLGWLKESSRKSVKIQSLRPLLQRF